MHFERCICSEIPELNLATRLALIMHYREVPKPSATGPLALEALPNHRFFIHGARDARVDLQPLLDEPRRPLLLFPSDDARVLSKELLEEDPRPVTLIVPDGNWGQARRAVKRIPGLEQVERVVLAPGPPTRWGLRAEPTLDGLSTFEAIARAFGVLEGERVQRELESLFDKMVQASIAARGAAPRIHRNDVANAKTPPLEILYQDEALVVVQKPSGSLVHRGWANDEEPVLQQLRDQIGKRVYPVHRLDRATSGALLFALSAEVCAQLQESFDAKTVDKR
ncbi:MAG: DTW domain-containing protein, partial [Polyangiaceae bacterium]|nr:DTW domain-containing protein [Polyangiaceae bacterium]